MSNTKIEWATKVWNPFTGCSKVSTGCDNCYAKPFAERMKLNPNAKVALKYRNGFKPTFHPEALEEPVKWKKPQRIFVCSMSDLFHEKNNPNDINKVLNAIRCCSQHTFLILTKRPERMAIYFREIYKQISLYTNLWLGVTAENQEQADKRIPVLLSIPAAKRFISIEPILSNIAMCGFDGTTYRPWLDKITYPTSIDWVIVGGETGRNARPIHPDWVRGIRNNCINLNIPFFFKQWGEWQFGQQTEMEKLRGLALYRPGTYHDWGDGLISLKIGKKSAGRLLDGKEYNQIPGVTDAN